MKRRNKTLWLWIFGLGFLDAILFAVLALKGQAGLFGLIILAEIAFFVLRNHKQRHLKRIWQSEGSVRERLEKMCAVSAKPALAEAIIPVVILAVCAVPLVIVTAQPKLVPWLQANGLMRAGNYEKAAEAYEQLGGYRDSGE